MRKINIPFSIPADHPVLSVLSDFKLSVQRAVLGKIIDVLLEELPDPEGGFGTPAIVAAALDKLIGDQDALEFCLGANDPEVVVQAKALYKLSTLRRLYNPLPGELGRPGADDDDMGSRDVAREEGRPE